MSPKSFIKWQPHLSLGITGHRGGNAAFAANQHAAVTALTDVFGMIDTMHSEITGGEGKVCLHSLLAGGVDQIAADLALRKQWQLTAPLPFGSGLNLAINAEPETSLDLKALSCGDPAQDPEVEARAAAIRKLENAAQTFQIADRDDEILALFEAVLNGQAEPGQSQRFDVLRSENVALAGRVVIERSDLLIAVWDGHSTELPGGTGHTIVAALDQGIPVLIIDPAAPEAWSIVTRPEELGHRRAQGDHTQDKDRLRALIVDAAGPIDDHMRSLEKEKWRPRSGFGFGLYRRIEGMFGGRTTRSGTTKAVYESPEEIAEGSSAAVLEAAERTLSSNDPLRGRLRDELIPIFAWADGVSTRLSDAYRSGMSVNFVLSAFAIIVGIAYLPFDLTKHKWIFASAELILLLGILAMTFAGLKRAWHRRWFETRRLAEYLRFAPALLLMGVARPGGRWPRGETREWPELFCRDALRDAGLPASKIDQNYLRTVLTEVVLPHVEGQRSYHEAKAQQLKKVHHRLDKSAEACFLAAVVSVSIYLLLELGSALVLLPSAWPYAVAKAFTFMGVAFPTLGANLAGIRYFGDFERFSAISSVTASKLREVEVRMGLLLSGDPKRLTYGSATEMVRMVDEIVVDEIEMWQSVFGAKHLALPA